MIFQVEFTWLVGLAVLFILAVWALVKVLVGQFDKRLDQRFTTQEAARTEAQVQFDKRLGERFAAQEVVRTEAQTQFDKRLDERFATQEVVRTEAQEHWERRLAEIEKLTRATDREMLLMRGDLPNLYVRREDHIRGQSVIEAKLDAISSELKMVQIKGAK